MVGKFLKKVKLEKKEKPPEPELIEEITLRKLKAKSINLQSKWGERAKIPVIEPYKIRRIKTMPVLLYSLGYASEQQFKEANGFSAKYLLNHWVVTGAADKSTQEIQKQQYWKIKSLPNVVMRLNERIIFFTANIVYKKKNVGYVFPKTEEEIWQEFHRKADALRI